jgi:hypothetical protein
MPPNAASPPRSYTKGSGASRSEPKPTSDDGTLSTPAMKPYDSSLTTASDSNQTAPQPPYTDASSDRDEVGSIRLPMPWASDSDDRRCCVLVNAMRDCLVDPATAVPCRTWRHIRSGLADGRHDAVCAAAYFAGFASNVAWQPVQQK